MLKCGRSPRLFVVFSQPHATGGLEQQPNKWFASVFTTEITNSICDAASPKSTKATDGDFIALVAVHDATNTDPQTPLTSSPPPLFSGNPPKKPRQTVQESIDTCL